MFNQYYTLNQAAPRYMGLGEYFLTIWFGLTKLFLLIYRLNYQQFLLLMK